MLLSSGDTEDDQCTECDDAVTSIRDCDYARLRCASPPRRSAVWPMTNAVDSRLPYP
jgi:hypothetical protein